MTAGATGACTVKLYFPTDAQSAVITTAAGGFEICEFDFDITVYCRIYQYDRGKNNVSRYPAQGQTIPDRPGWEVAKGSYRNIRVVAIDEGNRSHHRWVNKEASVPIQSDTCRTWMLLERRICRLPNLSSIRRTKDKETN